MPTKSRSPITTRETLSKSPGVPAAYGKTQIPFGNDKQKSALNGLDQGLTKLKRPRTGKKLPPIHPGEFLREDMLKPLGMSANALALALRVPATRIAEIVKERRGVSADTALRLGRYFGMTAEFWMNWQKRYELEMARDASGREIQATVRPALRSKTTLAEGFEEAA